MWQFFLEQVAPVIWLGLGFSAHIAKKAMKLKMLDKTFRLKPYLMDHPYQTYLSILAALGSYLLLWEGSQALEPPQAVLWSAAFFAGASANSFGDLAPGDRNNGGG